MDNTLLHNIIKLLAQQLPATTPASNTKAGPTTVPGSPTAFDPYSYFPTLTTGWGSNNVAPIRQLTNTLNWAIYILTSGQLDMNKLRATNFVVDVSKYPDTIARIVIKIALLSFKMIYNNGAAYQQVLAPEVKTQRLQILKNAIASLQLPDGGVNALLTTKIGGNIKQVILDTLQQIK